MSLPKKAILLSATMPNIKYLDILTNNWLDIYKIKETTFKTLLEDKKLNLKRDIEFR